MSYRRLCFVLVALLLSACGQTISISPPKAGTLPTAELAPQAHTVAPPTPNHQLIDTAILDDLAATPQPTSPIARLSSATAQPTPQARLHHEPTRLVIDDIALDQPLLAVGLDGERAPVVPKHEAGWFTQSAAPGQGE